jgi:hypothetical protein
MTIQVREVRNDGRTAHVGIVRTRILGSRLGRIEIEWVLDQRPDRRWLAAFDEAFGSGRSVFSDLCLRYGNPAVDQDIRIDWAVDEPDMASAAAAVWEAVAHANLRRSATTAPASQR